MTDGKQSQHRYQNSEDLLARAERVIPNGTGTFSRSRTNLPHGVSPFYMRKAEGARLWDVDGNEYTDFTMGLASVILGYCDPHVDSMVWSYLENIWQHPVLASLPSPLEIEVAEMLCDLIPCAEMVRFGKTGSDVTTAAIRLARKYTGRDHIAHCGYHGWHDWSVATSGRNAGIPQATRDLTHTFEYNDLSSLQRIFDQRPNQIAAVIMEPMRDIFPQHQDILLHGAPNFLASVRDLAHANGTLLIFDEMITGFRFSMGGAQEYFNVTPDLATFGKAMANGYPLSAVVGSREVMKHMTDVHFSYTASSETVGLAAAKATLHKLIKFNVLEYIAEIGERVRLECLRGSGSLKRDFRGHPAWVHLHFEDLREKTLFLQAAHQAGILCQGTINLCYGHNAADVAMFMKFYQSDDWKKEELKCQPLQPIFRPR